MAFTGGGGGISAGSTGNIIDLFLLDNTKTDGSGKTGLVFNSLGLTCYYHRNTGNASVQVSLQTMTLGTWATGGFIVVDGTNMPGEYSFGAPDAAFAAGTATEVTFYFQGAGIAPRAYKVPILGSSTSSEIIHSGTMQAGSISTTAVLDSGASAVDSTYNYTIISIVGGTGAGQSRAITAYVGSTRTATVSAWTTTPDNTSVFNITPAGQAQVISYATGQAPLQPTTAGRTLAVSAAGNVILDPTGLDNVVLETGINARQGLAVILASQGAVLSGAGTATVTIKAAGDPTTTRIVGTVDATGNRTAVTLTPPA